MEDGALKKYCNKSLREGQVALIFGTGPSINDFDDDSGDDVSLASIVINFGNNQIRFAMNGAVLASIFEKHSPDFFMAIDTRLADPAHYPGNLYYDIAMENPTMTKILPSWAIASYTKIRRENPAEKYPNVVRVENIPARDFKVAELYEDYPGYVVFNEGGVLGYTLGIVYMMGFRKIVLFGCDGCKYPGEKHYFFGSRYANDDDVGISDKKSLQYPGAVKKFFNRECGDKVLTNDGRVVNAETSGVEGNRWVSEVKAPNGELVYQDRDLNSMYRYNQIYIDAMVAKGCEVYKFARRGRGILRAEPIIDCKQLSEVLHNGAGRKNSS